MILLISFRIVSKAPAVPALTTRFN